MGLPHHLVSGSHRPPCDAVRAAELAPYAVLPGHPAERSADAAGLRGADHRPAGRGAGGDGHYLHRRPEPALFAGRGPHAGPAGQDGGAVHEGPGDGHRRTAQRYRRLTAAREQHRGGLAGAGPCAGVLPGHPQLHGHRQRERRREAAAGAGILQRSDPFLLRRRHDRQRGGRRGQERGGHRGGLSGRRGDVQPEGRADEPGHPGGGAAHQGHGRERAVRLRAVPSGRLRGHGILALQPQPAVR